MPDADHAELLAMRQDRRALLSTIDSLESLAESDRRIDVRVIAVAWLVGALMGFFAGAAVTL